MKFTWLDTGGNYVYLGCFVVIVVSKHSLTRMISVYIHCGGHVLENRQIYSDNYDNVARIREVLTHKRY